jgi:hypothetical protein
LIGKAREFGKKSTNLRGIESLPEDFQQERKFVNEENLF